MFVTWQIKLTFQKTVCGMSVVGNDWESLKRYNLAEIYGNPGASGKADTAAPPKALADVDNNHNAEIDVSQSVVTAETVELVG